MSIYVDHQGTVPFLHIGGYSSDRLASESDIIDCFLAWVEKNGVDIACGGLQHYHAHPWESFLEEFDLPKIDCPDAIYKELAFCWNFMPEGWEDWDVFVKQVRQNLNFYDGQH